MAVQALFTRNYAIQNGVFTPGAKATFYLAGTTTPATVYQDQALSTPHASPVEADANGAFPQVWGSSGINLKAVIVDSAGATIETIDPVGLVNLDGNTANLISVTPTANAPYTDGQEAVEGFGDRIAAADADIAALDEDKAPLASPALTGTPTAPTAAPGTNDEQIATTAFVLAERDWVYINSGWWTSGSFATLNFALDSAYECFFFSIEGAVPSADGASFELQMSADGGSTFYTGASDYSWAYDGESGTRFADQDNADSAGRITALVGNVKGMSASGFIYPASDANFQTSVHGHMTRVDSTGVYGAGRFSCALNQTVAINFMQLMFDSGTIDKCKWSLWGMKA